MYRLFEMSLKALFEGNGDGNMYSLCNTGDKKNHVMRY